MRLGDRHCTARLPPPILTLMPDDDVILGLQQARSALMRGMAAIALSQCFILS